MDKKPQVFPNQGQTPVILTDAEKIAAYEAEKAIVTNEIYTAPLQMDDTPQGHANAIEVMRKRTEEQLAKLKANGTVVDPALAEPNTRQVYQAQTQNKNDELIKQRDAALQKNLEQTQRYQQMSQEANDRRNDYSNKEPMNNQPQGYTPQPTTYTQPAQSFAEPQTNINPYILELSQPNYNAPFDVIPLPSKGKTYKNKKENIKIAYMTTADENILTSPNLLQSGEFLSVFINRKILDPNLRYEDLIMGDRNAIMIWLRATGYGEMYPITVLDNDNEVFDVEFNLNDLKIKELSVEPDEEGLFDYELKLSKAHIKFKLLTMGEIEAVERIILKEKEDGVPVNNQTIYFMERMIVQVNGSRDKGYIKDFVASMRINDAKGFNEYVEEIDCGVDMNITVGTPGGGSVDTFLPLNFKFFWPNSRI
jgi:hypothetical protein